jgi:hypothetical protein
MSCGLMSTITSAYAYRHKYKMTIQTKNTPIKNISNIIDPSYLKGYSITLVDSSYLEKILCHPNRSN